MKHVKIGLLGIGNVAVGTFRTLQMNHSRIQRSTGISIDIIKILNRSPEKDRGISVAEGVYTQDPAEILDNPEIDIVVELIGGIEPATEYMARALRNGKHVVTANKAAIAANGSMLQKLAVENNVMLRFEASVGGGTPIITPMHQCLAANHISQIRGIVNGTTNFMLTKMKRENMGFDEALKIAQQLGYAETKDPGDDVDGRDACRKIAILASLACGHHVYPDNIPARGIRDITVADIKAAEKLDSAIKLIAWYDEGQNGNMAAGVEPMLVSNANQLAGVDDVFNAVLMKGDMLGDVVFYGKGAGKLPTASAVVADVIDALKDGAKVHDSLFWKPPKSRRAVGGQKYLPVVHPGKRCGGCAAAQRGRCGPSGL